MKTYKATQTTFFYSSDFSGGVIITRDDGFELQVLGKDILEFIAYCYLMPKTIAKVESMDWEELLSRSICSL